MLGSRIRRFRTPSLTMGASVGLQLFECIDLARLPAEGSFFWRTGFLQICVTAPGIEALAAEIGARGGRCSPSLRAIPGRPCADAWRNSVEINSHDYVETRSFLRD